MSDNNNNEHFNYIYWFIVGICLFGAAFTVFLIIYLPGEAAIRIADTALIFWLSTAVAGGIGYLIGSSANKNKQSDIKTDSTVVNTDSTTVNENKKDEGNNESK